MPALSPRGLGPLLLLLGALVLGHPQPLAGAATCGQLTVAWRDPLDKVFLDDPTTSTTTTSAPLPTLAAPGEHLELQLVVTAPNREALTAPPTVQVTVSGFPGNEVFDVLYVNVTAAAQPGGRTGLFPDPLQPHTSPVALTSHPLSATATAVFWISLPIPSQAARGTRLAGAVSITTTNAPTSTPCTLPLATTIHRARVPPAHESRNLIDSTVQPRESPSSLPFPLTCAGFKAYYDILLSHRVNCMTWGHVYPQLEVASIAHDAATGEVAVTLNTTAHDEMLTYLRSRGVVSFRFPEPAHSRFDSPSHLLFANVSWYPGVSAMALPVLARPSWPSELNPNFTAVFRAVNSAIKAHYAAKGWLNMTYVMFKDEPAFPQATTLGIWKMLAGEYKALGLRIIQTTFPVPDIPEIHPFVDWWLPHVKQYMVPAAATTMAQEQAAGKRVSMYSNGTPATDLHGARLRTLPWMMWASNALWSLPGGRGLQGTLAWYSMDSWKQNPYIDANTNVPHRFDIAGFGYLLYPSPGSGPGPGPGSAPDPTTPLGSIRWKLFRKGLEDAELLFAASDMVAAKTRSCGCPATSTCCARTADLSRAIHRASAVVWGFYDVGDWSESTYTTNTTLFNTIRADIMASLDTAMQ